MQTDVNIGAASNFHLGAVAQGPPPVGSSVKARGIWGMKFPEAEEICRHCLQILTA